MRTVIVREYGDPTADTSFELDLREREIQDCTGCWSCWQRTPGRCAHKDLNDFYWEYLHADKVIFFLRTSLGFVSGQVKTLFDRMIPHYIPYTSYSTGESMHDPRYARYPDIEVYYTGEFTDGEGREAFERYLHRVFYQFHSKNILIQTKDTPVAKEETH